MFVHPNRFDYFLSVLPKTSVSVFSVFFQVDVEKALLLMDDSFATSTTQGSERKAFNDERPVACWKEVISDVPTGANPNIEICIAPNLVCSEAKQTAGGGDNISAAGLILQV